MARKHLLISGASRAGMTFLFQVVAQLRLDTGCDAPRSDREYDLRRPGAPYVVKGAGVGDYLDELLAEGEVSIDHTLVPVQDPDEEETAPAGQLGKLIHALARHSVPLTLLYFPRLVQEPEYLYRKIAFALKGTGYATFLHAFWQLSRPERGQAAERPEMNRGCHGSNARSRINNRC